MTQPDPVGGQAAPDLMRHLIGALVILLLIAASLLILSPFGGALVWATMIVIATWPMLMWVQRGLGGRRGLAVVVMTILQLSVFVVPLLVLIGAAIGNVDTVKASFQSLVAKGIPAPPAVIARIPLAGQKLTQGWAELAAATPEELRARLEPFAAGVVRGAAKTLGTVGTSLIQMLLIVVLSAVLYATGESAADGIIRFARRLGGDSGRQVVLLAAKAVRSVAMGIVITAVLQATLSGIGLFVTGVPFAGVLTALALMMCLAQLGPIFVLLPATAWLFWQGSTGWGIALLIWTILATTMDNVVRPLLIRRGGGGELPLLLIMAGVIGGLLSFGVIGLFVGPMVLAVTWTLASTWVNAGLPPATSSSATGS